MNADFWNGRNVLLTGASGMVGSHIAERLIRAGANVVALVRSRNPNSYFFSQGLDKGCTLAYGDLKDFERVFDIATRYETSCLLHVGAQPIVGAAFSNPLETFRSNIDGTVHVLEAARRASVESVVVASSDKAYGKSDTLPYVESMPMKGDAPYEVSKSCADLVSLAYARTYGLPVAVTRFGNIYGPGDLNFSRIVPGAIKAGLLDSTLDIRSDGKMMREYLYVADVAEGYLALAENIAKTRGEAFNFSSGERLRVLEVVDKVGKIIGKKVKTRVLNSAKNEIPEQYLSSEKVRKLLGWKAKFDTEAGLRKTVPWYSGLFRSGS